MTCKKFKSNPSPSMNRAAATVGGVNVLNV